MHAIATILLPALGLIVLWLWCSSALERGPTAGDNRTEPTTKQLEYARRLGVQIPHDCSRRQLPKVIDRAVKDRDARGA